MWLKEQAHNDLICGLQGGTVSSLAEAMDWLKEQLNVRNQDVGFCGASENVVLYAQSLLGDEVVQQRLVASLVLLGWLVVLLKKDWWRGCGYR